MTARLGLVALGILAALGLVNDNHWTPRAEYFHDDMHLSSRVSSSSRPRSGGVRERQRGFASPALRREPPVEGRSGGLC